ncbi:MAG: flagellar biosynthesis anti-sigma factor FlgM [Candidatus Magnetominusculus sp. LBB02]|nr:flagellar biosynthesis anti-sigma factor FlgM [Candidatus Magnetominusculus sp. LBB02]
MKINSNVPPEAKKIYGTTKKVNKTIDAGTTSQTNSADSVSLSPNARAIDEMTRAIAQLPDVREAKVAEVKQSVDDGTYQINPSKIAGKMIDEIA